MASLFNAWKKALLNYKPRKIRGAFWYRSVVPSRRKTILTMDGALIYGGRYNAPGEFGALYLSRTTKGCKHEVTRRPGHPKKFIVGKIKVTLSKVCDLTDPALLKKLKISKTRLTADDWDETQALGEIVRESGYEAMIVPSAAGDFNNLVVFVDRLGGSSRVELEEIDKLDLS
jgi:RES domain-containing protein